MPAYAHASKLSEGWLPSCSRLHLLCNTTESFSIVIVCSRHPESYAQKMSLYRH
jgi:hypothetical protein